MMWRTREEAAYIAPAVWKFGVTLGTKCKSGMYAQRDMQSRAMIE